MTIMGFLLFFLFSKTEEVESDTADANDDFSNNPNSLIWQKTNPCKTQHNKTKQNRKKNFPLILCTPNKIPKKIEKKERLDGGESLDRRDRDGLSRVLAESEGLG